MASMARESRIGIIWLFAISLAVLVPGCHRAPVTQDQGVAGDTVTAPVDQAGTDRSPLDQARADQARLDQAQADRGPEDQALPDQSPPDKGLADQPKVTCGYTCVVNLSAGTSSCAGQVSLLSLAGKQGRFKVKLGLYSKLRLTINVCAPSGWVLHIGNSNSNDGYGGDLGQFSNDSEAHIRGQMLEVYSNDWGLGKVPKPMLKVAGFLPASGCSTRTITVSDGQLQTISPGHSLSSPYIFRVMQKDQTGLPDDLFWVGLNRVIESGSKRTGSGLTKAEFCLHK